MVTASAIKIRILGDDSDLQKKLSDSTKRIAKWSAGAVTAAAAATAALVKSGLASADAQAKLSRQIGATTEGLGALQRAASRAGVSQAALTSAASNLNRRLGEAREAGGAAADTLRTLGLEADALARMDVDDRFAAISDAMQDAGMSSDQMAYHLRQLGIRQAELTNLMAEGGEEIRKSRERMSAFGVTLTEVDAAKIEAANDAMGEISILITGLAQHLAVRFAPAIEAISEMLSQAAIDARGMGEVAGRAFDAIVRGAAFTADAVRGLHVVFKGLHTILAMVAEGVLKMQSTITGAMNQIVQAVLGQVSRMVDALNMLLDPLGRPIPTGLLDSISDGYQHATDIIDQAAQKAGEYRQRIQSELAELAQAEMPGDQLRRMVEQWEADSARAAQAAVDARAALEQEIRPPRLSDGQQQELEERLAQIQSMTRAQVAVVEDAYDRELAAARRARDAMLITEQEYAERAEAARQQLADRLAIIQMPQADISARVDEQQQQAALEAVERVYDRQVQIADDALARQLISEQQHADRVAQARQDLADRLDAIESPGMAADAGAAERAHAQAVEAVRAAYDDQMRIAEQALAQMAMSEEEYAQAVRDARMDLAEALDALERPVITLDITTDEQAHAEAVQAVRDTYAQQVQLADDALAAMAISEAEHTAMLSAARAERNQAIAELEADQTQTLRDAMQQRLETMAMAGKTVEELLAEQYETQHEDLIEALERGLITRREYLELEQHQQEEHEAEMQRIRQQSEDAQTRLAQAAQRERQNALSQALGNMTSLLNSESRRMFEIGKAAAIADAVVDGIAATVGAYKVGARLGGPVLGAAYASAAGAATAQRVSAIRSQSFGNAGAGAVATGSNTAAVNAATAQVEQQQRSVSIDLALVGGNDRDRAVAGSIIEQINSEVRRGARIDRLALST